MEAARSMISGLLQLGDDEDPKDVLDRLGERALLVTVAVQFRFPAKVEDLVPSVPPRIWLLAEAARMSLFEVAEEEEDRVHLGLAFLYQALKVDAVTGRPLTWQLIKGNSEVDDFVAIHNALNNAAAQMQSDSPVAR